MDKDLQIMIPEPVTVVTMLHPLRPHERDIRRVDYAGDDIDGYVDHLEPLRDVELVIAVNGRIVAQSAERRAQSVTPCTMPYAPCVLPGDFISVCPIPAGGGDDGKNPIAMIAMIVVMIVAVVVSKGALAPYFGAYFAAGTAGATIAAGAIMAAGSMLVNAILPPGRPDMPRIGSDGWNESPTYGWGQMRQVAIQGGVIPVLYGTQRVAGQVISRSVEISGDNKEILNIMLAVCHGPLDADADITDIRINDQPVSYYNGVLTYVRKGSNADAVIPGFDEVVSQNNYGNKLTYDTPVTKQTDGTAVDAADINVMAPYGCYYANNQGGIDARSANYDVHYREVGAPSWTLDDSYTITGATAQTIRKTIRIDFPAAAQYEVKLTRTNEESADSREKTAIYWSSMSEIVEQVLIYPGVAKYAVVALATDQLSGGEPTFTCQASRDTVSVYVTGTGWVNKAATNPAWAAWDLLYNDIYGAGIAYARIDYTAFNAWATYCDEVVESETRHKLNVILDTQTDLWQALLQICQIGRAVPIRRGTLYSVVVDKTDTPVQMFTTGNIIAGTFKLSYLPLKDRANAVEVAYMDEDRDYTRQVVGVYSDDYNDSDEPDNKTSIRLFGCTSRTQAVREGAYRINATKYLTRTIEFEADIDAIAAQVGDLIYFQHDVPEWGIGGRIVSATANTVTLDQDVTLQPATTYLVSVRLAEDDTVEERTVQSVEEETTTDELTLTSNWTTTPAKHDVFAFGVSGTYRKSYRVVNISRAQELTRKIAALEYRSEVYTNPGIVLPEPPWDPAYQEAVAIYTHEFLAYAADGTYVSVVTVSWHPAYVRDTYAWEIWLEDLTSATDPVKLGETDQLNYLIAAQYLILDHQYKIYVSVKGEGAVALTGNTDTITIAGTAAPPSDVATFTATWNPISSCVEFSWSAVADIDLSHYEIRYGGTGWSDATVLIPHATGTSESHYIQNPTSQTIRYRIKAVDQTGNYSESETYDDCAIGDQGDSEIPVPTGLAVYTGTSIATDGTEHVWLRATWNNNSEVADFHHYLIKLIKYPSGYTSQHETLDTEYRWDLEPNVEYGVTLCAVDIAGNRTAFCTEVKQTTATDTTAPADVTWDSPAITAAFKMIQLRWNAVADKDLAHYEVAKSTNGVDYSTVAQVRATFWTDTGLSVNTQYWYKVRAVDTSGNTSANWSSVQTETTVYIDTADLQDELITAAKILADAITEVKVATGAITNTKIGTNAISSPKIVAGAVLAEKIGALAVTTGKLAANAVTAAKIAANTITAAEIAANTITAAEIAAGAIAADEIAANAVTAAKIDVSTLSAIAANVGTLTAGIIRSTNWAAGAGIEFDLTNEVLRCGGSSDPKLHWNGSTLLVKDLNADYITAGKLGGAFLEDEYIQAMDSAIQDTDVQITTSWQSHIYSTITVPANYAVVMQGFVRIYRSGTYTPTMQYAIYRGVTQVYLMSSFTPALGWHYYTFLWIEEPGSGSYTYYLKTIRNTPPSLPTGHLYTDTVRWVIQIMPR